MNGTELVGGVFASPNGIPDTNWRPVAAGGFSYGRGILWRHQISGENLVWDMDPGPNGELTRLRSYMTAPLADTNWKVVGPR